VLFWAKVRFLDSFGLSFARKLLITYSIVRRLVSAYTAYRRFFDFSGKAFGLRAEF